MAQETGQRAAGSRQIGLGVALLVVGVVLALLLVKAGVDTLASFGYVVAVAGLALIGNGVFLRRGRS